MKFWKEGLSAVIVVLMFSLSSLAVAVVGLVMYLETDICYLLVFGCILFILCTLAFLTTLYKVILTDEGIELKYGKKQLTYINWFDVTEVDVTYGSRAAYLTFFSNEKRIEIALSRKLYQTIMDICPSIFVKIQIDNHPALQGIKQWLEEKRNKKK